MKKWLVSIFLLLFAASAYGQDVGFRVITNCALITAPVANSIACLQTTTTGGRTAGHVYTHDGSAWVDISAGLAGAGTVTSVGAVGTANQITVTGTSPITSSGSWTFSIPTNPTLPGTTTGTFSGSGAAVTALNATNLASGTVPSARLPNLTGDVTTSGTAATTIANNAVTAAKSATVLTRRVCIIPVGNGVDTIADVEFSPFRAPRCNIPYNATLLEIMLQGATGTPTVLIQRRRDAATFADLMSGALAGAGTTETCAKTGISQTCINGTTSSGTITLLNTALLEGDWIEVKSGTGSTATSLDVVITFLVN